MPSSKTNLILTEVRMDDIKYDPYGTALNWHFAIAEVMHAAGIDIPNEWEYRPSPITRDIDEIVTGDDYPPSAIANYLTNDDVSDDDLLFAGNVLSRFVAYCHMKGKAY